MKKVLVFQHVAHEILGTFHPLLKQAGFRIRYVNFGRKQHRPLDVSRYDGVIILGGPMGVYEQDKYPHLKEEIHHITRAIRQDKPVLGICLGAQLIAAALGAQVKLSPNLEIGWHDVQLTEEGEKDPLLGQFQKSERIFQWHRDTFHIPENAVWLAQSQTCPQQAFRYGDKVYGFQFHLEVDEPLIERWLTLPAHQEELKANVDPVIIREESHQRIAALKALSKKVFSRYIHLFSSKRRTILLGSGHK